MQISQREKPNSDVWLLAVLVVVSFIIITIYFREGDAGPLQATRRGLHSALAPVGRAGFAATAPFRTVGSWFSGLSVSRTEIETLRQQNIEMRQRLIELEEARQENERLRELVGFVESRELEVLGARVIGRPTTAWESVITIDRGKDDGIETGMAVLAARGVIGQVVETSERSSKVLLITDQRSGVAAMLQSTRAEGVVRGSVNGDLSLDFVSRDTTVTVSDVVLTSGMGGVYPKGLLIGEVADVQMNEADLHPTIRVRPSAVIMDLEEVVVLLDSQVEGERSANE